MSATMVQPTAGSVLPNGNAIVKVRDLSVYYGRFHAVGGRQLRRAQEQDHRADWSLWLR